jgi:hypothetical protein
VVEWEVVSSNSSSPTTSVVGHSHAVNVTMKPFLRDPCPLTLSTHYPPTVALGSSAGMTTVPVQVCVMNVSSDSLSFVLGATSDNTSSSGVTTDSGFSWFGLTHKVVLSC